MGYLKRIAQKLGRKIGAFIVGAISFVSHSHAATAPEIPTKEYLIDTEIVAVEKDPDCDLGGFNGKGNLNVQFFMRIPKAPTETGLRVKISMGGTTTLTLNRPLIASEPFNFRDEVVIKYPIIRERRYEVEAAGMYDDRTIDTLVKLRRLVPGKRYCKITFRIKNTGVK